MTFFRRGGIAGALRNNSQLQQFVLPGVTPTGRLLGTGSYGSVEEVSPSASAIKIYQELILLLLQTLGCIYII